MNISAWLQQLGLERYARSFRENEIDLAILPQLTTEDLKEIGVIPVGDRRRILTAIAALTSATKLPSLQGENLTVEFSARPTDAERRQLTVMFVDLVGSTHLAGRLDPEELARKIGAYQSCCTKAVGRWDGQIAKFMGDGVLAYFGWPYAHEDDAERAVRAGLEVVDLVAELTIADGEPMACRVGIATGVVLVGELIGQGMSQEHAVVGETPNLAARLQGVAEPGCVVIAPTTQRLVGGLFELTDVGEHDLKGFAGPIRAWRVLGESYAETRFEALHSRQLSELIGRDHEIDLLIDFWKHARNGNGQVALLTGEPGMGKSRIVHELSTRVAEQTSTVLNHDCSPYHASSPLYPVIGMLERAAGFAREDQVDRKLAKLQALIARNTDQPDQAIPFLADLLSVPVGDPYSIPVLGPKRRAERMLEVLVDQIVGMASSAPVLAVYEDVHWIDPTTLDLLGMLINRAQHVPILILITFRPDFKSPWAGHVHLIELSRLTRQQSESLVTAATGGKSLPHEVLTQILDKTDGVPLFVEELTKAILETGPIADAGDRYDLTVPRASVAIPATLQDSLMARLDRLGAVKEVAQIASVIGRTFSYDLLRAIAPLAERHLQDGLDQLVASELVFPQGTPPVTTYSFKHALVRDAAYQSLLRSKRQQLHLRVAEALLDCFPQMANAEPGVLAHHQTEAGLLHEAIASWREAGIKAIERSAFKEAVLQLSKGLELLDQLPDGSETAQELALRTNLGTALIATLGFGAAEVGDNYSRAQELSRAIGQVPEQFSVLWGSWVFHTVRAELNRANVLGGQLLDLARVANDDGLLLQSHHALETSLFWSGRFRESLEHMEFALAIYDIEKHGRQASFYGGHDPCVCCFAFKSLTTWICGNFDLAERCGKQALQLSLQLKQPGSLAHAQQLNFKLDMFKRDAAATAVKAKALIELATMHGFRLPLAIAMMALGWSTAKQGDVETGVAQAKESIDALDRMGARTSQSLYYAMLAEVLHNAGQADAADRFLDAAFRHCSVHDERFYEAELWTLRGRFFWFRDRKRTDDIEQCFQRALRVARQQGARAWELRAATGLARLWADQGRQTEASTLLRPILAWYSDDDCIADILDARSLLVELS